MHGLRLLFHILFQQRVNRLVLSFLNRYGSCVGRVWLEQKCKNPPDKTCPSYDQEAKVCNPQVGVKINWDPDAVTTTW